MATKPETAESAKPPAKSKKMLIIIVVAVVLVALIGGGGFFYISKQRAASADGEEETSATAKPSGPPTFLPLDNMVVNLADPGGEKVAQVGITLELTDSHATDLVKVYLPTIRSGVLLLISQRTSEELLKREGKEKLASDILLEASKPFGAPAGDHEEDPKLAAKAKAKKKAAKDAHGDNPVRAVLFSSFIVQ